jgi:hypothetical protein
VTSVAGQNTSVRSALAGVEWHVMSVITESRPRVVSAILGTPLVPN